MNHTEHIRALERQRRHAMVTADLPALNELFADDMLWIHGNARPDTKAGVIGSDGLVDRLA